MLDTLTSLSRPQRLALAAFSLAAVGVVDWMTGPELAFSVFYLIPVALLAWTESRWQGFAAALVAGGTWLLVEISTNHLSHPAIPYWNGTVRTAVFAVVAFTVSLAAERTRELRALNASLAQKVEDRSAALRRQTGLLESILDSIGEGVVVGDAAGRPIKFNPAARAILGMRAEDTVPADQPAVFLRALLGEPMDDAEIHWVRQDSPQDQWLVLTARPISQGGERMGGSVLVFRDVTERRHLERQVAETSEREQRRLGADLHDGVCQQLVGIAFAARILADKLSADRPDESRNAAEIADMLNAALAQTRTVARGLYLVELEDGGLVPALEELASQTRFRHRVDCAFDARVSRPVDDPAVSRELYRITQEAVANALKHGLPTRIRIGLEADHRSIRLRVSNDGQPVRPDAARDARGMGLHMMRHRARLIGGSFVFDGSAPDGAEVRCDVPR
jgi:PAS domain S-box-containing protein